MSQAPRGSSWAAPGHWSQQSQQSKQSQQNPAGGPKLPKMGVFNVPTTTQLGKTREDFSSSPWVKPNLANSMSPAGAQPSSAATAMNPSAVALQNQSTVLHATPIPSNTRSHVSTQFTPINGAQVTSNTSHVHSVSSALQDVSIVNNSWRRSPSRQNTPQRPSSLISQPGALGTTSQSAQEKRDAKVVPSKASGGIPNPTKEYLARSNESPQPLQEPQNLLVVIDLNGTLLFRPSRKQPTKFIARPNTREFLKYCIETFSVVIWSSARPENVKHMCEAILTPDLRKKVVAIWGRDQFGLSSVDYNLRVQCYKRLTKLWAHYQIAKSHPLFNSGMGRRWDQTNTVLIDDSLEKGRSEPFNLIEIPEFFGDENESGEILPQVHDYLNLLSLNSNVSACLRARPFKAVVPPPTPSTTNGI